LERPVRVILFAFWGRRENVELQLPFIRRILAENPNVEFEGWDLARDRRDSTYLRTIKGDRITVRTEFYDRMGRASRGQVRVWNYYRNPQYQDCAFVKLDDDDVFLETGAFPSFIQAVVDNPESVISALTVNNGASTKHIPELWSMYETLGIPLLDVHLSAEYAERSHRWFFDNWRTMTRQSPELIPADTWVSINCIGYTWHTGCAIAKLLNTRPPEKIMDREYPYINADGRRTGFRVGDEGAANMQPILIHKGFVAGHLNFGPQQRAMDSALLDDLRKHYTDIGRQYLGQ
jgi:hypothetical protein